MEEAVRLFDPLGELQSLWASLGTLAFFRTATGELDSSRRWLQRAMLTAERLGDQQAIIVTTALRAWLAFLVGAWDEARVDGERAVTLSRQADIPWPTRDALLRRGQLCLAEGHWAEASSYLEEAAALAARLGDLQVVREASSLLAELEVLAGRPEVARERLLPLLDRPGLEESDVTTLLPVLAWAHLDAGDLGQAEQVVALALRRGRADNLRLALVDALRVQALVALRRGVAAEAGCALDEGLALAQHMGYPYAEARLLGVYGRLHSVQGERGSARERLEAALAVFRRLGARKEIEQIESMLTVLG
jgi:tetratricopeptide (TPR) repeat protein